MATLNYTDTTTTSDFSYKPSYLAAGIVGLAILALYILTLAPTSAMWDAGEYMAAVKNLGLPHPPGNPFFMILGNTFGLLPISESYAVRINFLAAFSSAISAAFWFLVTERVLVSWFPHRWQRIVGGVLGAVIGATAFTVWNQSVVNEKVYTVSLALFAVSSWLMVRWADGPDQEGADNLLLLVAYLMGVGYANHPAGFLTAPAVGVVVAIRRPWKFIQADILSPGKLIVYSIIAVLGITVITAIFGWLALGGIALVAAIAWMRAQSIKRFPLVLAVAGVMGLGLTPFAYAPIRAAWFPKMNSGEPTACVTEIGFSCTFNKVTFKRLSDHIHREQYGQKVERHAPYSAQVGMWWTYFKWQWFRDIHKTNTQAQNILAFTFLGLGLLGGYVHWRRDRRSFWFFGPLMFTLTLALIYYLNFKYGASQAPELGDSVAREVRDRDYFYIWSFSTWGVWAALGLAYLWHSVGTMLSGGGKTRETKGWFPSNRNMLMAMPILAIAFVPFFANYSQASRAGETFTRDWAHDMLNSVEPYGILITAGDNDTYPLWYAQEVENIRKDVVVIVTTYLNMNWAIRQLIRNPIHEYDSLAGPEIYRGRHWEKPTGPPLNMTFEQADALPPYTIFNQPQLFTHGNIEATIPAGFMAQDQMMILRMIKDSYPQRPIYFSYSGTVLALRDYIVSSGLAYKLMPERVVENDSIKFVQGEYIELDKTQWLWNNYFEGTESLIAQKRWMDTPSISIPFRYAIAGLNLSRGLREEGRIAEADSVEATVRAMAEASGIARHLR